jgi:hypothetical protein
MTIKRSIISIIPTELYNYKSDFCNNKSARSLITIYLSKNFITVLVKTSIFSK